MEKAEDGGTRETFNPCLLSGGPESESSSRPPVTVGFHVEHPVGRMRISFLLPERCSWMQPAPSPDPRAKALGWLPKVCHHQLALCYLVGILESKNVRPGWFPRGQPIQHPPLFWSEYLVAQRRGMTCSGSLGGLALTQVLHLPGGRRVGPDSSLSGRVNCRLPRGQVYLSFSAALGWSGNAWQVNQSGFVRGTPLPPGSGLLQKERAVFRELLA